LRRWRARCAASPRFGGALLMMPRAFLFGPALVVPVALALESFAAAPMLAQTCLQVSLAPSCFVGLLA
jgi:hypothetical protein